MEKDLWRARGRGWEPIRCFTRICRCAPAVSKATAVALPLFQHDPLLAVSSRLLNFDSTSPVENRVSRHARPTHGRHALASGSHVWLIKHVVTFTSSHAGCGALASRISSLAQTQVQCRRG